MSYEQCPSLCAGIGLVTLLISFVLLLCLDSEKYSRQWILSPASSAGNARVGGVKWIRRGVTSSPPPYARVALRVAQLGKMYIAIDIRSPRASLQVVHRDFSIVRLDGSTLTGRTERVWGSSDTSVRFARMPVEHSIEIDTHKSFSKSLDLIWFGAASEYSERRVDVNSLNIDFWKPNETRGNDLGLRGFHEDVLPALHIPKASRSAHYLPSIILFNNSEHPRKQSGDFVTLKLEFS